MNILVPHSWLLDFIRTSVSPEKLARTVSLCGPSFERTNKTGKDLVHDIEITTNRPDTASIIGIAREAATILPEFGIRAKFVEPYPSKITFPIQKSQTLPIKIKAGPETILRFSAIVIDNVKIKNSPAKICKRLESAGIRPINNLVDLTNYIMIETGQPMHAFDYDSISGQIASIQLSKPGEQITTLDNKTHDLPQGSIIIRDQQKIIDLAGIMGGANSQITSQTKRVLLIAAAYNPKRIRSTSLKLAHRTQAATLFEKGIDPELTTKALHRSIKLLNQLSPGSVIASELVDIYPNKYQPFSVNLNHHKLESYLGIPIKPATVLRILNSLEISSVFSKKIKTYTSTIPSHRSKDMEIEEDLIEEIARIYGYHKLPSILPPQLTKITPKQPQFIIESLIKKILLLHGFSEVYTSPIISEELLTQTTIPAGNVVKITNPLSENTFMRPSLIPSMAQAVKLNLKYTSHFSLFELANIYLPKKNDPLPVEKMKFCLFSNQFSVSEYKGIIDQIITRLGIKYTTNFHPKSGEFDPDQSVSFVAHKKELAIVGITKHQKSNGVFALIHSDELINIAKPKVSFQPIPVYPPTFEDITIEADSSVKIGDLVKTILNVTNKITNITYVEGYTKNRSTAHTFTIELRDGTKTISKEEATMIKTKILSQFK